MGQLLPSASPFRHEAPLASKDLCDRDDELASLVDLAQAGRFVRLLAPRRFGKTSLLRAAFERLERDHKAVCVLCDLDGIVSRADLASRIHAAYAEQLEGNALRAVSDYLAAAGISLSVGGIGFRAQLSSHHDSSQAIETLLDAPRRVALKTRRPVTIALDEFQVVLALDGVDALLRSRIQHQAGDVSYIFCGSEPSMMESLFQNRARPLYGQALPLNLGPLPRAPLATYIYERFKASDKDPGIALDLLLDVVQGHPQRAMLLAHMLWLVTPVNSPADESTFAEALAYVERETEPELEAIWRSLGSGEQRTLRAIAQGHTTSIPRQVQQTLDLPRQTSDAARKRLIGNGIFTREQQSYQIVDPLLRRWVLRRAAE